MKKILLGAALVLSLPILTVLVVLVSVSVVNRTNGTIVSSGEKRVYLLHVPNSYDPTKPTPLVISLHGAMTWPALQMKLTRWNETADENGFIVVYPAGTDPLHLGPMAWFMEGQRTPSRMPDVVYIAELIDTLEATYNIDPARIYANGLSNGGGMAFALSCTLSHRIAAVGAVSAAQSLPFSWCPDSTPMPMIAFHGTGDRLVPYTGSGPGWLNPKPFPDVRTWVADWARRNHCSPEAVDSVVASDVTRLTYGRCANDAAVVLYTVSGGGHQWFGGKPVPEWLVGPTSNSIDATSLMWQFFRVHPRRSE